MVGRSEVILTHEAIKESFLNLSRFALQRPGCVTTKYAHRNTEIVRKDAAGLRPPHSAPSLNERGVLTRGQAVRQRQGPGRLHLQPRHAFGLTARDQLYQHTLVVRWIDSTLEVTNLGPARARDVTVSIRPKDPSPPAKEPSRPPEQLTVAALGNGYTHHLPNARRLGGADQVWIDLTWKDDRLRRQTDAVFISQQRTPAPSGPTIPDRQIETIAARLGEGVGHALNKVATTGIRGRTPR